MGHSSRQKAVSGAMDLLGLKAKSCEPHDTSALLPWAFPTCLVLPTPGPLHITAGTLFLSFQVWIANSQQTFSAPHHLPSIMFHLDLSSLLTLISTGH